MSFRRLLPVATFIAILAGGCAFSRGTIGEDLTPEAVESIKSGTTKAEVLSKLGAPDRLLQLNGRDVMQYYHYDAKAGSLLLILINFSRLSVKSNDLFILINQEGLVEDVISSRRTDNLEFRFWPFGD